MVESWGWHGAQLLERHPGVQVLVLEKESAAGQHQTGHNSGVLHCGLYYQPGSARARLAVTGIRRMVAYCQQHNVPYDLCGKTVIATEPEEIPRLHALFERGKANGLEGLQLLGPEQIREYEPHAAGAAGIRVPQEGIVDYAAVCVEMVKEIREWGCEIRFSSEVTRLHKNKTWTIHTRSGDYQADFLINCAGLHCDRVGRKAGSRDPAKIIPFRGEYYMLKPERQHLARNLIYPVPDPKFPFLGVHFTRLIHGGVECGPTRCWFLRARVSQGRLLAARHHRDDHLPRILEILAALSAHVLVGIQAVVQQESVLPIAAAAGPGTAHRRPGSGRYGRARAGASALGRAVAGLSLCAPRGSVACVECAQPHGHRFAGHCR